jgi:uncharacterized iron-regulated protein
MLLVLTGCAGPGTLRPPEGIEPGGLFAAEGGDLVDKAAGRDYVLVGEGHTVFCDHRVQASVLASLAEAGLNPAVGLEMVSAERQGVLDRFNAGELRISELREALDWDKTWGHPFRLYVPVFGAARKYGLPLHALNVPREVRKAVSEGGLDNVPRKQRGYLPREVVPPAYEQEKELFAVYEAHAPKARGEGDQAAGGFERFMLVQSLWDSAMADNAVRVAGSHDGPLVILAGAGHVEYGLGIARRIKAFDPGAEQLILTPWRGMGEAEAAAGDIFFYCPPTHASPAGFSVEFRPGRVVVEDVEPGSRAEAAGMREGDRLAAFNGSAINGASDYFRALMRVRKEGGPVTFLLRREGGVAAAEIAPPGNGEEEVEEGGEDAGTP